MSLCSSRLSHGSFPTDHDNLTSIHSGCVEKTDLSGTRRAWPGRAITDFLVGMFFLEINRSHEMLHAPSFRSRYDAWCNSQEVNDRSEKSLSDDDLSFGVLVLRVCLLSIQSLPHSKYPTSGVLSTHLDQVEHWFSRLADQVGNCQALRSKPSIITVQHKFYHVCYLLNYGKIRPSWSILSAAVSDARELGLHQKDSDIPISEVDMELRRRMFWNLYVRDRYVKADK